MEHRDRAGVLPAVLRTGPPPGGQRDRQAVGGHHHRRDAFETRRLRVRVDQFYVVGGQRRDADIGGRLDRAHGRPVYLTDVGDPGADLLLEPGPVLADRLGPVVGQPPEVEARVRAFRESAATGGEHDPRAGEIDPHVLVPGVEGLGQPHLRCSSMSGIGFRCAYSKCAPPRECSVEACAQPPTRGARSYRCRRIDAVSVL